MTNRDQIYRSHSAARYARVVSDAHDVVRRALAMTGSGRVAVGVSGGKDSVAMAHIVAQYCKPIVIYNDSGLEMPESLDVVRDLASRLGLELHIAAGDAITLELSGHRNYDAIVKPVQQAIRDLGVELEFVGLRCCESRNRRMLIGRYGPIHRSSRWGCLIAWPMRYWSSADVFAYIDEHNLPLHPAYMRSWCGIDRNSIRVSWAYDPDRHEDGDGEYLRRYYPSLYHRLKSVGLLR